MNTKQELRDELKNVVYDMIEQSIKIEYPGGFVDSIVDVLVKRHDDGKAKYIADHFSIIGIRNVGPNDPVSITKDESGIMVNFRGRGDGINLIHFLDIEKRDAFFDKIKSELVGDDDGPIVPKEGMCTNLGPSINRDTTDDERKRIFEAMNPGGSWEQFCERKQAEGMPENMDHVKTQ